MRFGGVPRPRRAITALIGVLATATASLGTLSASPIRTPAESDVELLAAPQRVVDTRPGFATVDDLYAGIGRRAAGSTLEVQVAGRAGIPANATVVVLNVTAVAPVERGYVTVHPSGTDRPNASNVNYASGRNTANEVIARVGVDGSVSVYTSAAIHLVIDIAGHFSTNAYTFSNAPQRVVDTRPGFATVDDLYAGIGRRAAGSTLEVQVAGRAGIPANATVVVLNVTAVAPVERGYVTVHPSGTDRPNASNVNYASGRNTANEVIARVGVDGSVSVYTSAAIHLVIDIAGHLSADPDAIDWDAVGPGWALFTYAVPDVLDDPAAEYDATLMLLSPTDATYEVGPRPGPYPHSYYVVDLSADGRTAVLVSYADDLTSFSLLDLPTMSMTAIPAPSTAWNVQFSRDDRSLLIEEHVTTQQPDGGWLVERIALSRTALDGTDSQTLVDLRVPPEQQLSGWFFSYVERDSGEFATIELGVAWLRSPDGLPIRRLQPPNDQCSVVKQWPNGDILVRCPDPSVEPGCWTNGLFLMPVTGATSVEFAMPDTATDPSACYEGYSDAASLGDRVALQRTSDGSCGGRIELTDGTSTATWTPDDVQSCDATLLGIRDDAWLALVRPVDGTSGAQYEGPGVLYEINRLGDSRPLTPTTLLSSWNTPGILANVRIVGS